MKKNAFVFLLCSVLVSASYGRENDSTQSIGTLSIHIESPAGTHENSIVALIDSSLIKTLPFDSLPLIAGIHHIIVAQGRAWNGLLADTTISVASGANLVFKFSKRYEYTILSSPPEAAVTIGNTKTGETPFQFTTSRPLSLPVTIAAMGYEPLTLEAPLPSLNVVHLSERGEHAPKIVLPNTVIRDEASEVYISLAAAIAAGTISAIAKHRADGLSDAYSATGNISARESARRYDVIAGVSLFVTEVSFGALTYYLLLQ